MRARCRTTQQLLLLIASSVQISSVSRPSISRIMKTRAVPAGRRFRQASKITQKLRFSKLFSGFPSPKGGPRVPVAVAPEQRVEIGVVDLFFGFLVARFAHPPPDDVDDLVPEDREHPGLELGALAKAVGSLQCGEHCFLHGILGTGLIAQLQHRKAQHLAPEAGQFAAMPAAAEMK
jgi:hypothetical protein